MALFDEQGRRIRGKDNREVAEHALARVRVSGDAFSTTAVADPEWIVARVASNYLQYCERSFKAGSMSVIARQERSRR